jgi:hypothetical protein
MTSFLELHNMAEAAHAMPTEELSRERILWAKRINILLCRNWLDVIILTGQTETSHRFFSRKGFFA